MFIKILKYFLSSFLFLVSSFLIWFILEKLLGACFTQETSFIGEKINALPFVILWNGLFFTLSFNFLKRNSNIKTWQFALASFWLTRYFHELFMHITVEDYTTFMMQFGMLQGLISIFLWSYINSRIFKKENQK